jgi:hypothetical protein
VINQLLHRQPTGLDRAQHRLLRIRLPVSDWSVASRLNSMFVAAAEFGEACREFPIVFVRAGAEPDGTAQIAPVAVFGLGQEENLYLEGARWRGAYMPALLRMFPFCMARVDDQRFAVCFDATWPGAGNAVDGQRLFDDLGQPTQLLTNVQQQLEQIEREVQRTRLVGAKLMELELLRDMRFDATLPSGQTVAVDGFLTVDEAKLNALPDAVVLDLQRTGVLGLVHAHLISMGNMRKLADWRAERSAAAPGAAPLAPPSPSSGPA